MHLPTKEYIQDATSLKENGLNHVVSAENLRNLILITTKGMMDLVPGVSHAVSKMLLKINEKGNWQDYNNFHSTVKPIKLMSYLITLGSREGDLVFRSFCRFWHYIQSSNHVT